MPFLDNLRQKPVFIRKILMAICVLVSAAMIFSFWLNSLKNTLVQNRPPETETPRAQTQSMPSLKEILTSTLSDIAQILKLGKEKIKEINQPAETEKPEENTPIPTPIEQQPSLPEIKPQKLP